MEKSAPSPLRIPAAFMRGGTSKGLFFHERDLPPPGEQRDRLLLRAMGSPDLHGRQLDGMGGGVSSVSKVIIVRPAIESGTEVEFLHGQVAVDRPVIDYSANCGNLAAAVGPFAVDEGLLQPSKAERMTLRLRNLNTGILLNATLDLADGRYNPSGAFETPGVMSAGSRIVLEYLQPGLRGTNTLFPTGNAAENLIIEGRNIETTCATAAVPMVWVDAAALDLDPTIMPVALNADLAALELLEELRRAGAARMGLLGADGEAKLAIPKIGILGKPRDYTALNGDRISASDFDILARVISMGRAHLATPLIAAMCLAAVAQTEGTLAQRFSKNHRPPKLRIGTPSGIVTVGALLNHEGPLPTIERTISYSSARRLMDGWVTIAGL
jgi:hypothetical protein